MDGQVALSVRGLTKSFGGARALDDVSLTVARGEVHGLLGSNGSGKSTLIKVLAGFHAPEPGADIALYGQTLRLPIKGEEAHALGLAFVHQNLGLIPSLSVAENFSLTRLATEPDWRLSWPALNKRAADAFEEFGLNLNPKAPVETLSAVEQAMLAIVRAAKDLSAATEEHRSRPGVLVLDEPTPFLPRADVETLFALIRQVTASGASVVFVSHDIDEVRTITDRATILRDGRVAGTVTTSATDHDGFVELIVGKRMDRYAGAGKTLSGADVLAKVDRLAGPGFGPVSFSLSAGEIVGLAGLIGAGFETVPARLYGARQETRGTLTLNGETLDLSHLSPRAALKAGIAFLPADRLGEAGVGSLPLGDNMALPVYRKLVGRFGLTDGAIGRHAATLAAEAAVKPNNPQLPLSGLSGGNQQKALMAKWLQIGPTLYLLDEPTQGVDVGARQQIWDALDKAAEQGAAILIASTDYEQLAALCHRVLIFAGGTIRSEISGGALSKDSIAEACFGATRTAA
ncbi:MAG: sugar ABC transporter ATP-binding protein [Pseudomonadota bacterium]